MLLGAALGSSVGVALGCLQDEDFVTEYAAEVCRMVRDCDRELRLPGLVDGEPDALLPASSRCEALVEARYASCASSCEFRRSQARRCLRRLRDNECATEGSAADPQGTSDDEAIPWACSEVFEQCEGGMDQDDRCSAPTGCSVAGRAGAGASALPLVGLVLLGLRRRWYLGRR